MSKHRHLEKAIDSEYHYSAFYENRTLLTHDKELLDEKRYPRDNTYGCFVLPGGGGNETEIALTIGWLLDLIAPSKRPAREALDRVHRSGILDVRNSEPRAAA